MKHLLNDIKSYCQEGTLFQYYRPGMVNDGVFDSERNATRLFNGVERTVEEISKCYDYYVRLYFASLSIPHSQCKKLGIKSYIILSYQHCYSLNGAQKFDNELYVCFCHMHEFVMFYLNYSDIVLEKGEN